jgi:hypothetical protein
VQEARVESLDQEPSPLQVDGDYIGRFGAVTEAVQPRTVSVVA